MCQGRTATAEGWECVTEKKKKQNKNNNNNNSVETISCMHDFRYACMVTLTPTPNPSRTLTWWRWVLPFRRARRVWVSNSQLSIVVMLRKMTLPMEGALGAMCEINWRRLENELVANKKQTKTQTRSLWATYLTWKKKSMPTPKSTTRPRKMSRPMATWEWS